MPHLHLTDLEARTIRVSLERLEMLAEHPPTDVQSLQERLTSAVATIRNVLESAEERGAVH
jgi:DeoR/GlpR family transcriptional regulator of sugar metabolism